MDYTGERVIPKIMNPNNGMLKEHVARYEFASRFVWGRILDIACGVGYGTEIILNGPNKWLVDQVVGVDIDQETVNYARQNYCSSKTKFMVGDSLDQTLKEKLGQFNAIVSFETIEHVEDDDQFVLNLKSLLTEDGVLIISTPLGRGQEYPCASPFHFFQYTLEEFAEKMKANFSKVKIYLQKDIVIEEPIPDKKYYLAIAICEK